MNLAQLSSIYPNLARQADVGSGGRCRAGDVVTYVSERPDRWCRENMAVAAVDSFGVLRLWDTYWSMTDRSMDAHVLTKDEADSVRPLFNLADYETVTTTWEWERYAPADRQVVTSQHGLTRVLYVRKGAVPDLATQLGNARDRLSAAEAQLASAQHKVEFARRDLADLEAAAAAQDTAAAPAVP